MKIRINLALTIAMCLGARLLHADNPCIENGPHTNVIRSLQPGTFIPGVLAPTNITAVVGQPVTVPSAYGYAMTNGLELCGVTNDCPQTGPNHYATNSVSYSFGSPYFVPALSNILWVPGVYTYTGKIVATGSPFSPITNNLGSVTVNVGTNNADVLLDVDFGGGTSGGKTGYAAIGDSSGDRWNYFHAGGGVVSGALANLVTADGYVSPVGMLVTNLPASGTNGSSDAMYNDFLSATSTATVTFTNLPAGTWSVYLYSDDGNFDLSVRDVNNNAIADYGAQTCHDLPISKPLAWQQGGQYVVFTNVTVGASQQLVVSVAPGQTGAAVISGLQIASAAHAAPSLSYLSGIIGWWPAEGNPLDIISGITGTVYPTTTYTNGMVGQAFRFDGVTGCVMNPVAAPMTNIQNTFTMEFWAYPQKGFNIPPQNNNSGYPGAGGQSYAIFPNCGYAVNAGAGVSVGTNGIAVIEHGDSYMPSMLSYTNPINGWTHIAVVYINKQPQLYVNGVFIKAGITSTRAMVYASKDLGGNAASPWSSYGPYKGLLDEVTIYNRALSASEIAAIYNTGSSGKSAVSLTQDSDYDGVGDLQELADRTNPNDPNSDPHIRLGYWRFDNTNTWVGDSGQLPLAATNIAGSPSWSTNAAQVDSARAAILKYRDVETNGNANINLRNGTIRFWFRPDWNSANAGGSGPGACGRLLELGSNNPSFNNSSWVVGQTNGWWALFFATNGNQLLFGSSTNGFGAINLAANITWVSNQWHQIVLAYSPTNSLLYLDGQLATNGGLNYYPNTVERSAGFRIGSDQNGTNQARGSFDELETFNYVMSATNVWGGYWYMLPSILTQPTNQLVFQGEIAVLSVTVGGGGVVACQWLKNGTPISGATASSLMISNTQPVNAGSYSVVVSNALGCLTSASATLTVAVLPSISSQPVAQVANRGSSVSFSVAASGSAPLGFQWRLDGANIAGANASTYTIASAQFTNEGLYSVVVTNVYGHLISSDASFAIQVPLSITNQPVSQTVGAGGSATFVGGAVGTRPLSYQWLLNGSPIAGATSSYYNIDNVQSAQAGTYSMVVTNASGCLTSSPAILTVESLPRITQQPQITLIMPGGNQVGQSITAYSGSTVTIVAEVAGVGPFTYQWFRDGIPYYADLFVETDLANATELVFTVQAGDEGHYQVEISNADGSVVSQDADLTVISLDSPTYGLLGDFGSTPNMLVLAPGVTAPVTIGGYTMQFSVYDWQTAQSASTMNRFINSPVYFQMGLPGWGLSFGESGSGSGGGAGTGGSGQVGLWNWMLPLPVFPSSKQASWELQGSQNGSIWNNIGPGSCSVQSGGGSAPVILDGAATYNYYRIANLKMDYGVAFAGSGVWGFSYSPTTYSPADGIAVTIVNQPSSQCVALSSNCTLHVVAQGTPPLNYQWYYNDQAIDGAAGAAYQLTNFAATNAGNYTVSINDGNNNSILSAVATVCLSDAEASMVVPVASVTYYDNDPPTLLADMASVTGEQASCAGTLFSGITVDFIQTNAPESVVSGQSGDVLDITDGNGVTNAWDWVGNMGYIHHLYHQGALVGTVSGGGTNSLQIELVNGLSSGTVQSLIRQLTISNTNFGPSSISEWVRISLALIDGRGLSARQSVTEIPAVNHAAPVCHGNFSPISLIVNSTVTVPFTISDPDTPAWRATVAAASSNQGLIPNANVSVTRTGPTNWAVSFTATCSTGNGSIILQATDSGWPKLTGSQTLPIQVIQGPPVIAVQPASWVYCENEPIQLQMSALSCTAPSYQWMFNGANLSGATQSSYAVAGTTNNAGVYSVNASNSGGVTASSNATIRVVAMRLPAQNLAYDYAQPALLTSNALFLNLSNVDCGSGALFGVIAVDFVQVANATNWVHVPAPGGAVLGLMASPDVTTSGTNVYYDGTFFGSMSGGSGTNALQVQLASSVTATMVQTVVNQLIFNDVSGNPSTAPWTARVALQSADATRKIFGCVTGQMNVNHYAPTLTGDFSMLVTTDSVPTVWRTFTVADADTPVSRVTVTGYSTNWSLMGADSIQVIQTNSNQWAVRLGPLHVLSGLANLNLCVMDSGWPILSNTYTIPVDLNPPVVKTNTAAPVITGDLTAIETIDSAVSPSRTISLTDADSIGQQLTLTAASSDTNVIPSANIILTNLQGDNLVPGHCQYGLRVLPVRAHTGTCTITLRASDGGWPILSSTAAIQVIIDPTPSGTNPRLGYWRFNHGGTNYWLNDEQGLAPATAIGLQSTPSWSGDAVCINSALSSWLEYPSRRGQAATNPPTITYDRGSLRFWFRPDWGGRSSDGTGPGKTVRLFESGQEVSYSWIFALSEVTNSAFLISKLQANADLLSGYIYTNLSDAVSSDLSNPTAADVKAMVEDINMLLLEVAIYDVDRFSGITLRPETTSLLASNPQGEDLVRLNRMLLEDAYPGVFVSKPLAPSGNYPAWFAISIDQLGTKLLFETQSGFTHTRQICGLAKLPTHQWCQVALTCDTNSTSQSYSLYFNGQLLGSSPPMAYDPKMVNALQNQGVFRLGCAYGGLIQAGGAFDELETFSYALTSDQIAADYASETSVDTDGDGLSDILENGIGSNPLAMDSDCDGLPDGWEYQHGYDPNDASDATSQALNAYAQSQLHPGVVGPVPVVRTLPGKYAVYLAWDGVPNPEFYQIFRSTNGGGPFLPVGISTNQTYADQESWASDNVLNPGTSYYYLVRSTDQNAQMADSAVVMAVPFGCVSNPPPQLSYINTLNVPLVSGGYPITFGTLKTNSVLVDIGGQPLVYVVDQLVSGSLMINGNPFSPGNNVINAAATAVWTPPLNAVDPSTPAFRVYVSDGVQRFNNTVDVHIQMQPTRKVFGWGRNDSGQLGNGRYCDTWTYHHSTGQVIGDYYDVLSYFPWCNVGFEELGSSPLPATNCYFNYVTITNYAKWESKYGVIQSDSHWQTYSNFYDEQGCDSGNGHIVYNAQFSQWEISPVQVLNLPGNVQSLYVENAEDDVEDYGGYDSSARGRQCCAVTADGKLWQWGRDNWGLFGRTFMYAQTPDGISPQALANLYAQSDLYQYPLMYLYTCNELFAMISSSALTNMYGLTNLDSTMTDLDAPTLAGLYTSLTNLYMVSTNCASFPTSTKAIPYGTPVPAGWTNLVNPLPVLTLPMVYRVPDLTNGSGQSFDNVKSVSIGKSARVALKQDGTLWSWGYSPYLGRGVDPGLPSVIKSTGYTRSIYESEDTLTWYYSWIMDNSWNVNPNYLYLRPTRLLDLCPGRISIQGNDTNGIIPGRKFVEVQAAKDAFIARCQDGTIWWWGDIAYRTLDNQSTDSRFDQTTNSIVFSTVDNDFSHYQAFVAPDPSQPWAPVCLTELGDPDGESNPIIQMSVAGPHLVFLRADGSVIEFGCAPTSDWQDYFGVGKYYTTNQPVPVLLPQGVDVVAVQASETYAAALDANGDVWVWGVLNDQVIPSPRLVPLKDIVKIVCSGPTLLALDKHGSVWGWGSGLAGGEDYKILQDFGGSFRTKPVRISGVQNVSDIYGGSGSALVVGESEDGQPTSLAGVGLDQQVQLAWNAYPNAQQYDVYRSLDPDQGYALIGSATASTYFDGVTNQIVGQTAQVLQPLVDNQTYFYKVTAVINGTETPKSSGIGVTPQPLPSSVPNFTLVLKCRSVLLSWGLCANSTQSNPQEYRVDRAAGTNVFEPIAHCAVDWGSDATSLQFEDTSINTNTTYTYRVVAINDAGVSVSGTLTINTADGNCYDAPVLDPNVSVSISTPSSQANTPAEDDGSDAMLLGPDGLDSNTTMSNSSSTDSLDQSTHGVANLVWEYPNISSLQISAFRIRYHYLSQGRTVGGDYTTDVSVSELNPNDLGNGTNQYSYNLNILPQQPCAISVSAIITDGNSSDESRSSAEVMVVADASSDWTIQLRAIPGYQQVYLDWQDSDKIYSYEVDCSALAPGSPSYYSGDQQYVDSTGDQVVDCVVPLSLNQSVCRIWHTGLTPTNFTPTDIISVSGLATRLSSAHDSDPVAQWIWDHLTPANQSAISNYLSSYTNYLNQPDPKIFQGQQVNLASAMRQTLVDALNGMIQGGTNLFTLDQVGLSTNGDLSSPTRQALARQATNGLSFTSLDVAALNRLILEDVFIGQIARLQELNPPEFVSGDIPAAQIWQQLLPMLKSTDVNAVALSNLMSATIFTNTTPDQDSNYQSLTLQARRDLARGLTAAIQSTNLQLQCDTNSFSPSPRLVALYADQGSLTAAQNSLLNRLILDECSPWNSFFERLTGLRYYTIVGTFYDYSTVRNSQWVAASPSATATPQPVLSLGAQAFPYSSMVLVQWYVPGMTNYVPGGAANWQFYVERKTGTDDYSPLTDAGFGLSYLDTDVVNGQTYTYRVTAMDQNFNCIQSVVFATPSYSAALTLLPPTPGNAYVDLSWTPVRAASFQVERSLDQASFETIATLNNGDAYQSAVSNYRDANIQNGVRYYYRIEGMTPTGLEFFSNTNSAVPLATLPPLPPDNFTANLTASPDGAGARVMLSWNLRFGADHYQVFIRQDGSLVPIFEGQAGSCTYDLPLGLLDGTTLLFDIRCATATGLTGDTEEISTVFYQTNIPDDSGTVPPLQLKVAGVFALQFTNDVIGPTNLTLGVETSLNIQSISFYDQRDDGNHLIGTVDSTPFAFTWIQPPGGHHQITATANVIVGENVVNASQNMAVMISDPAQFTIVIKPQLAAYNQSATDLQLPSPGLPITLSRSYCSYGTNADLLGVGWVPGWSGGALKLSVPITDGWVGGTNLFLGSISEYFVNSSTNHEATVTLPSGASVPFWIAVEGQTDSDPTLDEFYGDLEFGAYDLTQGSLSSSGGSRMSITATASDNASQWLGSPLTLDGSFGGPYTYVGPDGTSYLFGLNLNSDPLTWLLTSITDRNGNSLNYTYGDGSAGKPVGQIVAITHSCGMGITLNYTSMGPGATNITVFDPLSATVPVLTYVITNNQLTEVDRLVNLATPNNLETNRYIYGHTDNDANRLIEAYDPRGVRLVANSYMCATNEDTAGNLLWQTNEANNVTWYNLTNNVLTVIQFVGTNTRVISVAHDDSGAIIGATQPVSGTNAPASLAVTNTYDDRGRLIAQRNAQGGLKTFTYDDQDHLTGQSDEMGNSTSSTVNSLGEPTDSTDANGNSTSTSYDDQGNPVQQTDAIGAVTLSQYADSQTAANGRVLGKRLRQELRNVPGVPYALVTQYTYVGESQTEANSPGFGQIESVTTEWGLAEDNVLSQIVGTPITVTYQYDSVGNRIAETKTRQLPNGGGTESIVNQTSYDALGRAIGTLVSSTVGGILQTSGVSYGITGKQLASADTVGRVTFSTYDFAGNLIETAYPDGTVSRTAYNADGRAEYVQDRTFKNGNLTTAPATHTLYDDSGQAIKVDRYDSVQLAMVSAVNGPGADYVAVASAGTQYKSTVVATGSVLSTTRTYYDSLGRVQFSVDARTNVTESIYDDAGRRTTNCVFLAMNTAINDATTTATLAAALSTATPAQSSSVTYDPNGNQISSTDSLGNSTTNHYDAGNRVVQVDYPSGTGIASRFTAYDGLGQKIQERDEAGVATGYTYDFRGLLTSVTLAFGTTQAVTTVYGYDELGNQILQTDALGHSTTNQYDGLGRRIARYLPGGQMETFGYDLAGNPIYHTNFNGVIITNIYDANNRLTNCSAPGYKTSFAYNATGLRTSMVDASGTNSYVYDGLNRLTSKTVAWIGAPAVTLNYGYDVLGSLTNLWSSTAKGVTNVYQYDLLGRLRTVLASNSLAASYGYDAVGNLQSLRYGNGVTNLYQYDARNRLTSLLWKSGGTTLANFGYTVAPTGNRTSATEIVGANSHTYNWTYDYLYRMTGETFSGNGFTGSPSVTYGFDAVGNRTNRNSSVSAIGTQTATYTANDWLGSDKYDSNGNTTNSGTAGYQYDVLGHLTNVNSGQIFITYDGDGNRVKKTVNGTTTYYLVDDHNPSGYVQVLEEYQGSSLTRVYNYGLALISQQLYDPGSHLLTSISYYGTDGHGSTRFLTDVNGNITDTYTFDAYGLLIPSASSGSTPNNYLYCGQQWDGDLGMYYLRARYYKPDTGRFWTMDTYEGNSEDPLSLHKYLYCHGDSVNYSDLSGNIENAIAAVANLGLRMMVFAMSTGPVATTVKFALATITLAAILHNPDPFIAASGSPAEAGVIVREDVAFIAYYGQRTSRFVAGYISARTEIQPVVEKVLGDSAKSIYDMDKDALVGYQGSLARGYKGPHKGNSPFDPSEFDVDAFVVSDKLAAAFPAENRMRFVTDQNLPDLAKIQQSVDTQLRASLPGLKTDPFSFRVFTYEEYLKKIGNEAKFHDK